MRWRNTARRYSPPSIGMHWLVLALMIGVYACIELRQLFPKGSAMREALKSWHFMLGLSGFALVFLRLALRLEAGPAPEIRPAPPRWQRHLAEAMHLALYAFLVVTPLLGWLTLSAKGKPIPFFGLALPALIGADKALAGRLEATHETLGTMGYFLIGLHAAAALFHHYVLRDDALLRMLPRRRRREDDDPGERRSASGPPTTP